MNIVANLLILAAAVACATCAVAIHKKIVEAERHLRRLLAFLDAAHVERRKERQEDRNASAVILKTVTDDLRGCRNSIDAIREASDELSEHRRETVEVRGSSAPVLPSGPAQIAAGLRRPRSPRPPPPPPPPARIDPPPRSQTIVGMAAPEGPRALPLVVPPPITRPRVSATLPSMAAAHAFDDPPGCTGDPRSS